MLFAIQRQHGRECLHHYLRYRRAMTLGVRAMILDGKGRSFSRVAASWTYFGPTCRRV